MTRRSRSEVKNKVEEYKTQAEDLKTSLQQAIDGVPTTDKHDLTKVIEELIKRAYSCAEKTAIKLRDKRRKRNRPQTVEEGDNEEPPAKRPNRNTGTKVVITN